MGDEFYEQNIHVVTQENHPKSPLGSDDLAFYKALVVLSVGG
jgi:hypothetical protein